MKTNKLKKLVIVVLLLSSLNFFNKTTFGQAEIKIMSFNIRYGTAADGSNHWNKRQDLVYNVINEYLPDLLGVQEALHFQINEIIKNISGYKIIGEGREGGQKGEYSAILYKSSRFEVKDSGTFWLSNTPEVPSKHWGNTCIRICTWSHFKDKKSGVSFFLYNTHLDHESQLSREKSIKFIVKKMKNQQFKAPFILTGDFNAGEKNTAMGYIPSTLMVDTFRVIHPSEKNVGTFNGFKGYFKGEKIDYIFVSSKIKVLSSEIVRTVKNGKYPSDHFPVTARIIIKSKQ